MATLYADRIAVNLTMTTDFIYLEKKKNSDPYGESVLIVCVASCALSILGSLLIFWTYYAMPEIRNFTRKLVVCLTVADFLSAAGYLLGTTQYIIKSKETDIICLVQSYITTYSSLVSFLLTIMTAVHIYVTVVKQPDVPTWRRFLIYNLVSWVIPGIALAVAKSYDVLGHTDAQGTGPWCWVKKPVDNHGTWQLMWQLALGKGWEITCYLVTTALYVLLKLFLYIRHHHERFGSFHSSLRDEDQNFLYIFLIFYIIRLWGTIRFFIFAIKPSTDPNSLYMQIFLHLQAAGDPAQAFCNCILFCFLDASVRKHMCSCRRHDTRTQSELTESAGTRSDTDQLLPDENMDSYAEQQHRNSLLNSSNPVYYGTTNKYQYDSDGAHSYNFKSPRSTPYNFKSPRSTPYDFKSPRSTPCFTQRLSPASFRSVQSDNYSEAKKQWI